jgi:hypothetical protein
LRSGGAKRGRVVLQSGSEDSGVGTHWDNRRTTGGCGQARAGAYRQCGPLDNSSYPGAKEGQMRERQRVDRQADGDGEGRSVWRKAWDANRLQA